VFTGERHQFSLSFNEVRDRPIFPMYAEHRDRAVRLAEAPAELVVHFTHAAHLRIEQVYPPTSIRRLSEMLESTEVVSLFMGSADGITPQHIAVQFGYFSRLQGLMIVLIPLLLLAAGPALGPTIGRAMPGLLARVRARLHWARLGRVRGRAEWCLRPRRSTASCQARLPAETSYGCAGRRSRRRSGATSPIDACSSTAAGAQCPRRADA
jgi:hypothetical protein